MAQKREKNRIKRHPGSAPIMNADMLDREITEEEKMEESDEVAMAIHKMELNRSLDRDEASEDIGDIDPAPPEGA